MRSWAFRPMARGARQTAAGSGAPRGVPPPRCLTQERTEALSGVDAVCERRRKNQQHQHELFAARLSTRKGVTKKLSPFSLV